MRDALFHKFTRNSPKSTLFIKAHSLFLGIDADHRAVHVCLDGCNAPSHQLRTRPLSVLQGKDSADLDNAFVGVFVVCTQISRNSVTILHEAVQALVIHIVHIQAEDILLQHKDLGTGF